jgi:hypothetical protein
MSDVVRELENNGLIESMARLSSPS